ncbi:MAG: FAD-binding oxidoreductase [Intrasporangium sp.]|uniref:FAD-binding oxidoreductase n=1 Tax=Intrasporangium sp. TaxID=1925024 RepID=UPI0026471D65|nr:FAD-binding oxidoreductase [Intrasporangium sp.]MDN5795225.1 FAD-binding oxidoreductase [Intrasporangium sp.]
MTVSTEVQAAHVRRVEALRRSYDAVPAGHPVRLAKRTSNLFRPRAELATPGLDVAHLTHVLSVDPVVLTAEVEGMTTYEALVEATLAVGCMPLVVPQLRTITIGGAVTGLGIEASSFRNGLPHESVLEMDVLTGAGDLVTACPDGPNGDLFAAFPNSYGSLGYATRLVIQLERVHAYVRLRHVRLTELSGIPEAIHAIVTSREYEGEPVDFLDGVVFSGQEVYLTLGTWADSAPYTSDYSGQQVYYRSIQLRSEDYLTIRDYLWRWDTDWFWCSRAFGVQRPLVRRLWPDALKRSDVYWKIIRFENRHHWWARLQQRRGEPAQERVVQDVEIPIDRTADFLRWFLGTVPIDPIWLCPLVLRDTGGGARRWPLYPLEPGEVYVNVGFWSTAPILPSGQDGDVNRAIEAEVSRLGGHKSLYSDAYYDERTFWDLYGGDAYRAAKRVHDPEGRLPDLYSKAVRRR